MPLVLLLVRKTLLSKVTSTGFLKAVSRALFLSCALIALAFVAWVFVVPPPATRLVCPGPGPGGMCWNETIAVNNGLNAWGGAVDDYWRDRLMCDCGNTKSFRSNTSAWWTKNQECRLGGEAGETCRDAAFIWWGFPLFLVFCKLFFAVITHMLHRVTSGGKAGSKGFKFLGGCLVCALAGFYVAFSVAGADLNLGRMVMVLMMLFVICTGVIVGSTLGWQTITKSAKNIPMFAKMQGPMMDYPKGLLLLIVTLPVVLFYLPLSFLNQLTRRCACTKSPEGGRLLTAATNKQLAFVKKWHLGSVFSKLVGWGLLYLTLQVIAMKVIVWFCSALNYVLAPLHPAIVIVAFLGIGLAMFLIPVIPGVPVYVFAGAVLPAAFANSLNPNPDVHWVVAAQQTGQPPTGFWVGLGVACVAANALKFIAIAIQQEVTMAPAWAYHRPPPLHLHSTSTPPPLTPSPSRPR